MSRLLLGLTLILPLLAGCLQHRVHVDSDPAGAQVFFGGEPVGVTPLDFSVRWRPHLLADTERWRLQVELPDHRVVESSIGSEVRLHRYLLRPLRLGVGPCLLPPFQWKDGACRKPRTTTSYVLVREHGPAGTWTPEDAAK